MSDEFVRFQKGVVAVVGIVGAIAIAVGVPLIVLLLGQNLGVAVQTTIIIIAVVGGGLLGGISAFFGIVIPSAVGDPKGLIPRFKVVKTADGEKQVEVNGGYSQSAQEREP